MLLFLRSNKVRRTKPYIKQHGLLPGSECRALRDTHRGLDGLCGVAGALDQASSRIVANHFEDIASGRKTVPWMVVFHGFDETPVTTTFNTMYSELAPVATYFWRPSPSEDYQQLTFDHMGAKYPGRRRVRFGVNEYMAQKLKFGWCEGLRDYCEEVVVRPVFVENTKSSTLYDAFEKAHDNLGITGMIAGVICF